MNKAIKLTFIIISINLLIAALICISMFGVNSLKDFLFSLPLNIGIGIFGLYFLGYFIGKRMENLINKKELNKIFVGILGLLLILLIAIILGSTVGFLEEGLVNINSYYKITDALFDYYFKPLFWVMLFGIIPTIVTGMFLGYFIKIK
jgi:hypothetical protein